jgi:hypothetical protein
MTSAKRDALAWVEVSALEIPNDQLRLLNGSQDAVSPQLFEE